MDTYNIGSDDVLRICALQHEREDIINEAHVGSTGPFSSLHDNLKDSLRKPLEDEFT